MVLEISNRQLQLLFLWQHLLSWPVIGFIIPERDYTWPFSSRSPLFPTSSASLSSTVCLSANNQRGVQDDESIGLNELHTRLRDAVTEQDFIEAGRISDILLYRLHGNELANGSADDADRDEKLRFYRRRMSWKGLGAAPWLISRLDSLNFTFPTTIQINSMESVNAILSDGENSKSTSPGVTPEDASSMEDRIDRRNIDMGIVVSGTTGSGKSLAYLVPLLSTLSDSLFQRQRIRVGAEEAVGDTTGDLLDRLAIVTSPVVRSTARQQIRKGSSIATGAALSTLGSSGKDVKSPLALIVVPSRELGVQLAMVLYSLVGGSIKDSPTELAGRANMFKYKGPKGVKIGCVLEDKEAEFGLKLQTDVAITMPQYLGKLLDDKDIDAKKLRVVVFDEADLGLEQTPSATLNKLFEVNGDEEDEGEDTARRELSRLSFLVGASVTESLGNLAVSSRILPPGKSYIATATRCAPLAAEVSGVLDDETDARGSDLFSQQPARTASLKELSLCLYPGLKHQRAVVGDDMGLLTLTRLLRKELRGWEDSGSMDRPRVMIFFPSEEEAKSSMEPLRDALWGEHRLCVLLPKTGVGPLTMLDQFRRNETTVMLATPNSVRGLDVRGLTHVYTLYLPMQDPREYVHLAGRVGRVGQSSPSNESEIGGGNVISILRRAEAHQMDELADQLGFEFSDIDVEALRSPSYSKFLEEEDKDTDANGDLESMRRYLEDTMNLLTLKDEPEPGVLDVEALRATTTAEEEEDKQDNNEDNEEEQQQEEGGFL